MTTSMPVPEEKIQIIQLFISLFEKELLVLTATAKAAHEAATHEEAKSEDKHDTRATEASYLAKGQAIRVNEIQQLVSEFKNYLDHSRVYSQIEPGSLVEYTYEGKVAFTFFAQNGGGSQVSFQNKTIAITTPHSVLGEALQGLSAGDFTETETQAGIREYQIKAVS